MLAVPDVQEVQTTARFVPAVFDALVARFDAEAAKIRKFVLDNDDDEAFAAQRLIEVKTLAKKIEAARKELTLAHRTAIERLNALVKPYENKAAALLGAYSAMLGVYAIEKADRRLLAEKVAREAAADRDHEVAADALNLARDLEQGTLRGSAGGSVSIAVGWTVGGVDMKQLPEEYVVRAPNLDALKRIAKDAGEDLPPAIPGVTWVRSTSQVVRRPK
jgi:hypothetical protein